MEKENITLKVKGAWDGMCHDYNGCCEPDEKCYCREIAEEEREYNLEQIETAWKSLEGKVKITKGMPIEVVNSFHNLLHELRNQ